MTPRAILVRTLNPAHEGRDFFMSPGFFFFFALARKAFMAALRCSGVLSFHCDLAALLCWTAGA